MAFPNGLPPELVLHILRNYIPIEDKLDGLWPIPKFQSYLKERWAWKTSSKHISVPFFQWMHKFPSGWYLHTQNWNYRLFVKVDTCAMTLSFQHYLMDRGLDPLPTPTRITRSFNLPILKRVLAVFFNSFVYGPTLGSPTYHLKSDRRLIVDPGHERLIHMYDWEDATYDLPFIIPRPMKDEKGRYHFIVTLTYQRMLIVQCMLAPGQCQCSEEIRTLLPYCEGGEGPFKLINGETLKQAGIETFQADDNDYIEGTLTYEMKNLFYVPVNLSHIDLPTPWKD